MKSFAAWIFMILSLVLGQSFAAEVKATAAPPKQEAKQLTREDLKNIEDFGKQYTDLNKDMNLRQQEVRAAQAEASLIQGQIHDLEEKQKREISGLCKKFGHDLDCQQWLDGEVKRIQSDQQKPKPAAPSPSPSSK